MNKNMLSTILNGLAIAMGVAVVVLNILGMLTTSSAFTLLGIGLFALGAAGLQRIPVKEL